MCAYIGPFLWIRVGGGQNGNILIAYRLNFDIGLGWSYCWFVVESSRCFWWHMCSVGEGAGSLMSSAERTI